MSRFRRKDLSTTALKSAAAPSRCGRVRGAAGSALCAAVFAACGGGGSSEPFFAGVWSGTLQRVEDGCGQLETEFAFFNHLVNQSELAIVLDNGARSFSGMQQSETSFEVSAEIPAPQFGADCVERRIWRYEAIDEAADRADFVVRSSIISCAAAELCRFALSGSAFRRSADPRGPIPSEPPVIIDAFPVEEGSNGSSIVDAATL